MIIQQSDVSLIEAVPDNFVMRAPTIADVASMADMFNAQMQALVGRDGYSASSIKTIFSDPVFTPETDARIFTNEHGSAVAYIAIWNPAPYVEPRFVFRIHPEYEQYPFRQILMTWGMTRAEEMVDLAPQDALVSAISWCFDNDTDAIAYFPEAGFAHVRSSYRMRIALDQPIPEPQFPVGIRIETFANFKDLRKVYLADDEAFRDHWGYVAEPEEDALKWWQHWLDSSPNIDPNYWFLAMDGDEIAGISLCAYYLIGQENYGHVDSLGIRPKWRRQGIALNLLYHSFRELQQLGRTHVTLGVDAQSLTGATRLYKKAGMEVVETSHTWEKILRDGVDYRTQSLGE